jgi:very-short-patch-repair endonuclease
MKKIYCCNEKCKKDLTLIKKQNPKYQHVYCNKRCQVSHQSTLRWIEYRKNQPKYFIICKNCQVKKEVCCAKRNQKFCTLSCHRSYENKQRKFNGKGKEIGKKISKANKGHKVSQETKNKMSKTRTGGHHTEETKLKMRISFKGKNKGKDPWIKGKHHTEESKTKQRISALNRILENGQFCSIGKNEKQLLDEQEIKDNCKIIRQYNTGIGYITDGYCKQTNTIYEVYENYHKQQKIIKRDSKRKKQIIKHLNCKFIIIKDSSII